MVEMRMARDEESSSRITNRDRVEMKNLPYLTTRELERKRARAKES